MNPTVLVLGAGRSSGALIKYLLSVGAGKGWSIRVADVSHDRIAPLLANHTNGIAVTLDVSDVEALSLEIEGADVVISMLPAALHPMVARICLDRAKHLLTASYLSNEMRGFDTEARSKGLVFLNECGLDPGIDHMSAMKLLDGIRIAGGTITSFESFTGGLIAPETDPGNPWRYKFTWNPRNVVMAGQGVAKFVSGADYKYVPYQQLFQRTTDVAIPGLGNFEGYANRDSLQYRSLYGLNDVQTMIRGTLRNEGFCSAWNVFVQLGCCDDTYPMERVDTMTHQSFLLSFLPASSGTVEERVCKAVKLPFNDKAIDCLRWSGMFDEDPVGLKEGTPAQILEHILNKRWRLKPGENDMIVMWHRLGYEQGRKQKILNAYLVARGVNDIETAMAKTVGLPLGIATRLLLDGEIKDRGVMIPVASSLYEPILRELESLGIAMTEEG